MNFHHTTRGPLARRLASFRHALNGWRVLVVEETNARIHLAATLGVIAFAVALDVSRADWCWLAGASALVWMAEAFNSALERLADEVSEEHRAGISQAKDLAAGAVLFAAVGAAVIGVLVLGPPMLERVGINL